MSISTTSKSKIESNLITLEEYKSNTDKNSNANEKYSKVGRSHSEKNNCQFRWFKGSRDSGINKDLAA